MTYEFIYEFMYMKNIVKSYLNSCVPRFQMMTVKEQHPRSHHKGATSMQTHLAVRVGFTLSTDCIQFYVFATRLRHPMYIYKLIHSLKDPEVQCSLNSQKQSFGAFYKDVPMLVFRANGAEPTMSSVAFVILLSLVAA